RMGIDAPDGDEFSIRIPMARRDALLSDQAVLAGLELPADTPWPPAPIPDAVQDLGVVDTRAQRAALLDLLQSHPPSRLLLVCDGRQTPDRGVIALATELAGLARQSRLVLLLPARPAP